jgi:hypothetical protein
MLNAAVDAGLMDRQQVMLEMLLSIKRAGADVIITCFASPPQKRDYCLNRVRFVFLYFLHSFTAERGNLTSDAVFHP